MSAKVRAVIVGTLMGTLVLPVGAAIAKVHVDRIDAAQLQPVCEVVELGAELEAQTAASQPGGWEAQFLLPSQPGGGAEPVAEGPLLVEGEYLKGTLPFFDESAVVDVSLLIGKVVDKFKETDESSTYWVVQREVTGTVVLAGTTYELTGCQLRVWP
jgi:hypothetical protein